MLGNKKWMSIFLCATVLVVGGASAYAAMDKPDATVTRGMELSLDATAEDGEVFFTVMSDEDGTAETIKMQSENESEMIDLYGDTGIEWKEVTVEDVQAQIAEAKANLQDEAFMKNWESMGKTEEDMLAYITALEVQIKDIEAGMVFLAAEIEGADGMMEYVGITTHESGENVMQSEGLLNGEMTTTTTVNMQSEDGTVVVYEYDGEEDVA